jgi:hypothetical protein
MEKMEKSNSKSRGKQHWLLMQTTHVKYAHSHSLRRPDGCRVEAAHKAPQQQTKSSPQKLPQKLPRKLPGHFLAISNQLFVRDTFVIIQYINENIEQIYTVL